MKRNEKPGKTRWNVKKDEKKIRRPRPPPRRPIRGGCGRPTSRGGKTRTRLPSFDQPTGTFCAEKSTRRHTDLPHSDSSRSLGKSVKPNSCRRHLASASRETTPTEKNPKSWTNREDGKTHTQTHTHTKKTKQKKQM